MDYEGSEDNTQRHYMYICTQSMYCIAVWGYLESLATWLLLSAKLVRTTLQVYKATLASLFHVVCGH